MREHRTYTRNDDPPIADGDTGFVGVDMRTPPHLLPQGMVAEARNARFRYGVAEPRRGVMPLNWDAGLAGLEWDIEWDEGDINWANSLQFGKVLGQGIWNDPFGADWILIAFTLDDSSVQIFAMRPGNRAVQIKTPEQLTVPETKWQDVETEDAFWFTQAFDRSILSRGPDLPHLVMSSIDEGFVAAPDPESTEIGIVGIPNANNTLFFGNRLLIPHKATGAYKSDHVAVSDILDYTSYQPTTASFKINQGDSDNIVRLVKFNDTTVIVFKDTSIYAVSNLIGDWSQNAVLDQLTTEYGLVGARSVANVAGEDVWFLSQRGVVSLRQTELNKVQGVTLPQSSHIQPLIDRIDMNVARETACAAYWRDRYYLSVPLDGGQRNNAVLVYDFLNQAWSGVDDGDAIFIKYLFVADFGGAEHLFYVDYDGSIGLYEYGEMEGRPISQTSFTCDVMINGIPAQGSTLRINGGTEITAQRYRDIVDEAGSQIEEAVDEDIVVESTETNIGNLWGVGTIWEGGESKDPCDIPVDNLYLGYTSDGWVHNTDSVTKLDCGVRFTSSGPIFIEADDPYLAIICTSDVEVEDRPIDFMVITRGYGFEAGNQIRTQGAQLFISTWNPKYRVTGIVDGVKEEKVLVDDTTFRFPDRTKHITFGIEDWDIGNPNDDHKSPGRQDYSVILDASPVGGGTLLGAEGMQLDLYQHYTHKLRVDHRGSYFQIKLEGLDGRIRLHSVLNQSTPGDRREGVKGGLW